MCLNNYSTILSIIITDTWLNKLISLGEIMKPPHYFLHFDLSFHIQHFIVLLKIYSCCTKFNDVGIIIDRIFVISRAGYEFIFQKDKGIFFTGFI